MSETSVPQGGASCCNEKSALACCEARVERLERSLSRVRAWVCVIGSVLLLLIVLSIACAAIRFMVHRVALHRGMDQREVRVEQRMGPSGPQGPRMVPMPQRQERLHRHAQKKLQKMRDDRRDDMDDGPGRPTPRPMR